MGGSEFLLLGLALGVIVIVLSLRRAAPRVALIVLLCVPFALQRFDGPHLVPVAAVVFGILPGALARHRIPLSVVVIAALAPFVASPAVLRDLWATPPSWNVSVAGRTWPNDQRDPYVREVVDLARRYGGDLFVGPADLRRANYNSTFVYYLAEMHPSGRWLEFNPANANWDPDGLIEQLRTADVAVLSTRWDTKPESPVGSDAPNRELALTFRRVMVAGEWEVWVKH